MIAVIDYGVGNLFSLSSSLAYLGLENKVTRSARELDEASHIILPGVGAFGDAMEKLASTGLVPELERQADMSSLIRRPSRWVRPRRPWSLPRRKPGCVLWNIPPKA